MSARVRDLPVTMPDGRHRHGEGGTAEINWTAASAAACASPPARRSHDPEKQAGGRAKQPPASGQAAYMEWAQKRANPSSSGHAGKEPLNGLLGDGDELVAQLVAVM